MALSIKQGTFLVRTARNIITSNLDGKKPPVMPGEPWLLEKFGIFVTLHTFPGKELRGCIGFVEPRFALKDGITRAALAAAFGDPRFPQLGASELGEILVEVSVLSRPKKLNATGEKDIMDAISPKLDGVILETGHASGLFLPQVWDELHSREEFLENLCYKAGLSDPKAWCKNDVCLHTFRVQAFEEEQPGGRIVEENER